MSFAAVSCPHRLHLHPAAANPPTLQPPFSTSLRYHPLSTPNPAAPFFFFPGFSLRTLATTKATPTNSDDVSLFRGGDICDDALRAIHSLLSSCRQLKLLVDSSEIIGIDVRKRMDSVLERVSMLAGTAAGNEAARSCGGKEDNGRLLLAELKVLQREFDSLHYAIEMAAEGELASGEAVISDKGILSLDGRDDRSTIEVLPGPTYVMSIPHSDGSSSSQLSALRAEIERRVKEQLIKTRFHQQHTSSSKSEMIKSLSKTSHEMEAEGTIASEESILREDGLSMGENPYPMDDIQQLEARLKKLETEKESSISVELYEKVVSRIDNALFKTHQRSYQIAEELKQREALLVSFEKNLMHQQNELSEKVNQMREEITCMCTEEQMNNTIKEALNGMEQKLKETQDQIMHLGLEFKRRDMGSAEYLEGQDRINQEFCTLLEDLKCRLGHVDKAHEYFNKQIDLLDPQSMNAFIEEQKWKNSQIEKEMEKMKHMEDSIQVQELKLHEFADEVDRRVKLEELNDKVNEAQDEVMKEIKKSHNSIEYLVQKSEKDESLIGQLREEWKAFRKELVAEYNIWTTRISSLEKINKELHLENFVLDFRNLENRLALLQETQKLESARLVEMQKQIDMLERKGVHFIEQLEDEVAIQKQALLDDVAVLMMKSTMLKGEVQNSQQDYGGTDGDYQMNADKSKICITEIERLQMNDQRRVHLEKFFTIMGHVISQEIDKITANSTQHKESTKHLQRISLDKYKGGDMDAITLFYKTDWNKAFLHCCPDNAQWTEAPGLLMEELQSEEEVFKVLRIAAGRVEFVVTDGEGNWDRAPDGSNYVLEGPGVFQLAGGVLNVVSTS